MTRIQVSDRTAERLVRMANARGWGLTYMLDVVSRLDCDPVESVASIAAEGRITRRSVDAAAQMQEVVDAIDAAERTLTQAFERPLPAQHAMAARVSQSLDAVRRLRAALRLER